MAGLAMAAVLGPTHAEVQTAAEDARANLTELQARPFLEHLDRLLEEGAAARAAAEAPEAAAS